MRVIAVTLLAWPLFGNSGTMPAQVTNTELVNFAPGGVIRVNDSYADLSVEGWDRPEVEITVTKSVWNFSGPKQEQEAARRLERVRVVTKRSSDTELTISTVLPSSGLRLLSPLSNKSKGGVTIEYEIHAPRNSKLVIRHGTGSVFVSGMTGDVDAACGRGDIMLMLSDTSAYSIDAKSKFGVVSSDFEGAAHLNRYRLGERYITARSPSSSQIHLRMGFGGITIKAIPPEASVAKSVK
jgi:hypothetical protein